MFIEKFNYTDWDDNEREETCYFHLTESDLADMELRRSGGMMAFMRRIIETRDGNELANIFKSLIIKSYGEKSLDGKYFNKSPEVVSKFMQTPMYDKLYMRMLSDTDYALKFIIGILPKEYQKSINADNISLEVKKMAASGKISVPSEEQIKSLANNENKS